MSVEEKPTMVEWLFQPNSVLDKALRVGVGGFVLALISRDVIHLVRPGAGTTAAVCILLALVLLIPVLIRKGSTQKKTVHLAIVMLAVAYVFMGLLYFFNWIDAWAPSTRQEAFYDATTDAVGTLFFLAAWYLVSRDESDPEIRIAEQVAIALLCVLVFVAGATKLVIELHGRDETADYSSARLMLNLCNGAIFLSLYAQMRRSLGAPDPVTHLFILFYGCAQIAAHGRDCLSYETACTAQSTEGLVALVIAWTLLLGKIAFAIYLSYLFSNARSEKLKATSTAVAGA